jgi:hypothetical protein
MEVCGKLSLHMLYARLHIVGTAHIKSGAGHSQSSRFHFAKQRLGKHTPTATKLTTLQHQQYAYPWK